MEKERQSSMSTTLKTSGLLDRRNLKMNKLSPSMSGHPLDVHDSDVSPELDRLSPSLERSTKFRHFDHLRSQPGTPDSEAKVKVTCAIPSPLTTEIRSTTNSTSRFSSHGSRSSRTSPRSRRSYSDPDPVSHIPDIEVENVDEATDEGQDDNVFKFETEEDHSFLFKAASFVLHGARGLGRRNERIRSSGPGYNSSTKPRKPKMFLAKKSKKLVIRMPNGELVEGEFPYRINKSHEIECLHFHVTIERATVASAWSCKQISDQSIFYCCMFQ